MFFTAIIAGDFKKAHGLTSKTWAEKNAPDALKSLLGDAPKDLSFEVDRVITDLPTECTHLVVFNCEGKTGSVKATLIREAWPGKRNPQGDWGVDPDLLETLRLQDAEVVNPEKPKEEVKPEKKQEPETTEPEPPDYAQVLTKAEDLGIDVPEGANTGQIQELIDKELAAEVPGPAPKPAPKKAPAKKPAPRKPAAKPAAKKGGK